ncbi:MAG: hypothetical protein WDN28_06760 [Chthoniobacter sp.]
MGEIRDVDSAHFEVELQADNAVAPDEGLAGAAGAVGHQAGAGREVEGVAVPVPSRSSSLGNWAKRPVRSRKVTGNQPISLLWILVDLATEYVGQELRAEADAEDGFAGVDGAPQELFFRHQPRMVAVLVDIHPAAHDHEQVEGVESWRRFVGVERGAV